MIFTSAQFIISVIVLAVIYYIVPKKAQWPLLLIASVGFYYVADRQYSDLLHDRSCPHLIFIFVTFITAYLCATLIGRIDSKTKEHLAANKESITKDEKKAIKAKAKSKKWAVLLVGLIIMICLLCVTKYTNFVISNINSFLKEGSQIRYFDIIVPAAIS
ncbi:MAG: hypothetical protein J6U54_15485, partial [Clostridiales bacterium]|nr:hypothetical protein [Clostridiales bacterium]